MIDPLVSLAHALYSNKGVYAVLLGSGVSRDARIPTGWEITLELVRRVAVLEGVKGNIADPADWFRKMKGKDPDYANLLDQLAATPEERRAILHAFIAPTPEDSQAGVKVPTAAHHALARLVARGYVRVILTTNFDRLTETALVAAGVEPTVISSADDAAGAIPLTHAGCIVVKLHGDYLDTRIRNTPAELSVYDPRLDQYLDRVLDEFGLVVIGWSGEWDDALRSAIARCPTRRFTTWWAAHSGRLQERARDLAALRRAQIVAIDSANTFLTDLEQKVLSLEEIDRPHPLSVKLAVAELKRYLPNPQQRIRMRDLIFDEVRPITALINQASFHGDSAEFLRRVGSYEAASEVLRALVATGAHWCREEDEGIWGEVVRRLALPYRSAGGSTAFIELQIYPAVLAFYAAGLGATSAGRYHLLWRLFEQSLSVRKGIDVLGALLPPMPFGHSLEAWNLFYPPRGRLVAVNDHLFDVLKNELTDLAGDQTDFAALFDRFELLGSLSYLHRRSEADPAQMWFPMGRFVSRIKRFGDGRDAADAWFGEAEAQGDKWPPIIAGMFGGSFARFKALHTFLIESVEALPVW